MGQWVTLFGCHRNQRVPLAGAWQYPRGTALRGERPLAVALGALALFCPCPTTGMGSPRLYHVDMSFFQSQQAPCVISDHFPLCALFFWALVVNTLDCLDDPLIFLSFPPLEDRLHESGRLCLFSISVPSTGPDTRILLRSPAVSGCGCRNCDPVSDAAPRPRLRAASPRASSPRACVVHLMKSK